MTPRRRARTAWILFLGAAAAIGDVVTPKSGPPFRGTIISVDEKSVTVRTESETRVIDRSRVRKIEFGDALITGLTGREYVNSEYRAKVTVPEGWSISTGGGSDLMALKSKYGFLIKGINFEANDGDLMKGAIGGMKTTVPDGVFTSPEKAIWAGMRGEKVSVTSSRLDGVLYVVAPPGGYAVLVMIFCEAGKAASLPPVVAEWEKHFQFIPE